MLKPLGSISLLLTLAAPAPALEGALGGALAAVRPAAVGAHIRFLADDLLEGRDTGSRGFRLAARYVAAQMEASGLEPAGDAGSFEQRVPLRSAELREEQCLLRITREGRPQELVYGKDYVLQPLFSGEEVRVEAPVVFAGYGVVAPGLGVDDYAGIDVKGKLVAVLFGAPERFPSEQRAHYGWPRLKQATAAARGAVGMLTLRRPEAEQLFPWAKVRSSSRHLSMRALDAAGVPEGIVGEIRATALLADDAAKALFEGARRGFAEAVKELDEGHGKPFELPVRAEVRTASRFAPLESANVVARLPGSDPRLRDEHVVLSAHLDHLGVGEAVDGDSIYNGAYDNASGVAALLEAARVLAAARPRPRRSLLFLAVTGEERGLLGSEHFADHPTIAGKLVADVNLDCLLMLYPPRDVVAYGAEHSSLGRVVQRAASLVGLTLSPDPWPEQRLFVRSDQYSFVRHGVPSVFIVPGFTSADPKRDGAAIMREWLKSVYHTPKDDATQPMDLEGGARLVRANVATAWLLADEEARPAWNRGDFFGQAFGSARVAAAP
jgi:Zn-dependent M28 family amino/carboxypeptidase